MEYHKAEQDVKKNLEDIGFSEQEILLFFQYPLFFLHLF